MTIGRARACEADGAQDAALEPDALEAGGTAPDRNREDCASWPGRRRSPPWAACAAARYAAGESAARIAADAGCSPSTVLEHIRRLGVEIRNIGEILARQRRPAWEEAAREDYASGMSLRQIGRRYGVSHEAVRRRLLRLGVALRSRGAAGRMSADGVAAEADGR